MEREHFPSCYFAANLTKPASVAQYSVDTPLPSMLNGPPLPIFFPKEAPLLSGVKLSRVISAVSPLAAVICLFFLFVSQLGCRKWFKEKKKWSRSTGGASPTHPAMSRILIAGSSELPPTLSTAQPVWGHFNLASAVNTSVFLRGGGVVKRFNAELLTHRPLGNPVTAPHILLWSSLGGV